MLVLSGLARVTRRFVGFCIGGLAGLVRSEDDAFFLEINGGLAEPRHIVGAVQGNGDLLRGGRAVFVGNGHFKGFDLGFVLAESLDRVGVGFIGPLSCGGIEGQRAVVRGERGVRVAVGPVCAVSARA